MVSILLGTGGDVYNNTVIVQDEESDVLLNCLPTLPSTTPFTLRMADGSAPPPDLNFTVDPKQGIVIRAPRPSHSGDYICSVLGNAVRQHSSVFQITIRKSQISHKTNTQTD